MMKMRPASNKPMVSARSSGFRSIRNQSTSIGAPRLSTSSPAFWRTSEWRPSQPTTSGDLSSSTPSGVSARTPTTVPAFLDEIGRRPLHDHPEARIAAAALAQEIQEVPLRHQGDEFAAGRQMAEIRGGEPKAAEPGLDLGHLLMRQRQEFGQEAELVHELERRGMDGVAAKVAQKIAVLLQHHDLDP